MIWAERVSPIQEGDRVAYSARFLRSICCHTGPLPQARGTVKALGKFGDITVALVSWDGTPEDVPEKVVAGNLVSVKDIGREA